MKNIMDWFVGGGMITMFFAILGIGRWQNSKIDRVYSRLDDAKDGFKEDYVQKDVCKIIVANTERMYTESRKEMIALSNKIDILLQRSAQ